MLTEKEKLHYKYLVTWCYINKDWTLDCSEQKRERQEWKDWQECKDETTYRPVPTPPIKTSTPPNTTWWKYFDSMKKRIEAKRKELWHPFNF